MAGITQNRSFDPQRRTQKNRIILALRNRLIEQRQRLVVLPPDTQHFGAANERGRRRGIQRQRLPEHLIGLRPLAGIHQIKPRILEEFRRPFSLPIIPQNFPHQAQRARCGGRL